MRETDALPQQLDLFKAFDQFDTRCGLFLDNLIKEAQNMRYLVSRIKYMDVKDRVKKFWTFELEGLLKLQADLCASVCAHSVNHYHKNSEQFSKMWKRNDDLNCTECPDIESVISHHRNCNIRLKSAILSGSPCLKDSGAIIDEIDRTIQYHNRLFNSYLL